MNFESYANRVTSLRSIDCKKDEKKYSKKIASQKYKYDYDQC